MRHFYIDLLKVIGAFSVVLLHSTAYMLYNIDGDKWSEFLIVNSCTRLAVPIFFMCSGAVLMRDGFSLLDLKHRLLRLIIPLLFWSCLYELYLVYMGIDKSIIDIIQDICMDKVMYHFWFLYSLIGVCALLPILSLLCSAKSEIWKYLLGLSIFGTGIKTFVSITGVVVPSSFVMLPVCIFYFCLGYYLAKFKTTIKQYKCLGGVITALVITVLLTQYGSKFFGRYVESYICMDSVFILLASILFFMFCKQFCEKLLPKFVRMFINYFSKGTFCCYLVHVVILDNLYAILYQHDYYQCSYPVVASITVAIITFIISCFLGILLQKIPYLRKTV